MGTELFEELRDVLDNVEQTDDALSAVVGLVNYAYSMSGQSGKAETFRKLVIEAVGVQQLPQVLPITPSKLSESILRANTLH